MDAEVLEMRDSFPGERTEVVCNRCHLPLLLLKLKNDCYGI